MTISNEQEILKEMMEIQTLQTKALKELQQCHPDGLLEKQGHANGEARPSP
jgi:hypothetical protein